MKEVLIDVVNQLFEELPFSRKEEILRKKVQDGLLNRYETDLEEENRILRAGELIMECKDLESACKSVGCKEEDFEQYSNTFGAKNASNAKKLIRRNKKYIYMQSICFAGCFELILLLLFQFSIKALLTNGILLVVLISGFLFFIAGHKKVLHQMDFENLRYNKSGREYLYKYMDRYSKKLLNTFMLGIDGVGYFIFAILLSVMSSKYTLSDVGEQVLYMGTVAEVVLYLMMKNYLCKKIADLYFVTERRKQYMMQIYKIGAFSVLYFTVAITLLLVFRNRMDNIYNYFLLAEVIYFAGWGVYSLTVRKQLVFKNIVINVKRIAWITMVIISLLTYNFMSMDVYLTQPYVSRVSKVERVQDAIEYNEENGVYTITTGKENFKVLQLTDIHLGGGFTSVTKDLKALDACYELIQYTKPDLVIVTGDLVFPLGIMSFSLNNRAPIMQFANFMRNTGIPWAFTYGNHDTESMATLNVSEFNSLMTSLSFKQSGNLLYPYIQPDIYGRSNQMIEIRNQDGSLKQALFLLDSNDYVSETGRINEYDFIHNDQVEWYKKQVQDLSLKEGYTIPSMLFFHIPLQQYKEANELYEKGSDQVKYYYGAIEEKGPTRICCSNYPSKLFDTAVELGSTKAMFCGHDHYNNQSLEYKGIRLTYGYSIDYLAMPGIEEKTKQRGGTLISIGNEGKFSINPYRLSDITKKKKYNFLGQIK